MAITRKYFQHENVVLFLNAEDQPVPEIYHVFLHGINTAVVPDATKPVIDGWSLVLDHVAHRRSVVRNDRDTTLNPEDECTVYAGSLGPGSLEALQTSHMRVFLLQSLHKIAGSKRAQGSGNVAACSLLARLYGVKPLRAG